MFVVSAPVAYIVLQIGKESKEGDGRGLQVQNQTFISSLKLKLSAVIAID